MANFFKRKEIKCKLTFEQLESFKDELLEFMEDSGYGLHRIYSLYYDAKNYNLILNSILNPAFKEKFRIRSYGVAKDDKDLFFELKKKFKGVTYKRRISLKFKNFDINFSLPINYETLNFSNLQIKKEIEHFIRVNSLEPKVLITYDRLALHQKNDSNFRVTFDFDIRFKLDDLSFTSELLGKRVASEIDVLMEVKALNAYPLFFSRLLNKYKIYPSSFSKYAQTYQRYILNKEENHVI